MAVLIIDGEKFKNGKLSGLTLTEDFKLKLNGDCAEGYYESELFACQTFKNIVASWNSKTGYRSSVEMQVRIKTGEVMSDWFSYGRWSSFLGKRSGSSCAAGEYAKIIDDTVFAVRADGTAFQCKIFLRRDNSGCTSPEVSLLAVSPKYSDERTAQSAKIKESVYLPVPGRSQMVVPEIGNIICSPTSLAMILEYHGRKIPTLDFAELSYDSGGDMYGNWSYTVAAASELGFEAYVERCESIETVKKYLSEGYPVSFSIATTSISDIEGAPQAYPHGHLIAVVGYECVDGTDYIIVNDPADPDETKVKKYYAEAQVEKAWSGIIYVVKSKV